jgi:hypothetical protein
MDLQEPVEKPHSKNLRLHRQMQSPGTFLVTKCVEPRQRVIDQGLLWKSARRFASILRTRRFFWTPLLSCWTTGMPCWHVGWNDYL